MLDEICYIMIVSSAYDKDAYGKPSLGLDEREKHVLS